jgi:hypothetical protein
VQPPTTGRNGLLFLLKPLQLFPGTRGHCVLGIAGGRRPSNVTIGCLASWRTMRPGAIDVRVSNGSTVPDPCRRLLPAGQPFEVTVKSGGFVGWPATAGRAWRCGDALPLP